MIMPACRLSLFDSEANRRSYFPPDWIAGPRTQSSCVGSRSDGSLPLPGSSTVFHHFMLSSCLSTFSASAECLTCFSASRMSDISSRKYGVIKATQALEQARIARSSCSSLVAKARCDRAGEASTVSTSLHCSLNTSFHSSTKGPLDVSFGRMATLFYWPSAYNVSTMATVDSRPPP